MIPARARALASRLGLVASAIVALSGPGTPRPAPAPIVPEQVATPSPIAPAPPPAPAAAEPRPIDHAGCAREPIARPVSLSLPLPATIVLGEAPSITGSASMGTPTRGALWGGVELAESDDIERAGGYPWGTVNVVASIERAAREVRRCHPGSPRVRVGDIAREHGGWLRPHRSHQSGLDADVGYFYVGPSTWYQRATAKNLDVARTWALLRAFVEGGDVDTIFVDLSIQQLLKAHVATLGADEQRWLELFPTKLRKDTVIRHAWGHATHFHVRFRDDDAALLGAEIDRVRRPPGARRPW